MTRPLLSQVTCGVMVLDKARIGEQQREDAHAKKEEPSRLTKALAQSTHLPTRRQALNRSPKETPPEALLRAT